jgi:hypothetical protein
MLKLKKRNIKHFPSKEVTHMSRTTADTKAPGHEFWSNRPFNKHGGMVGKIAKKRTHKAERAAGKKMPII